MCIYIHIYYIISVEDKARKESLTWTYLKKVISNLSVGTEERERGNIINVAKMNRALSAKKSANLNNVYKWI